MQAQLVGAGGRFALKSLLGVPMPVATWPVAAARVWGGEFLMWCAGKR